MESIDKDSHSNSEERLDEIIAAYLENLESGRKPSREEFIARYPDHAQDLKSFFANQDLLDRLNLKLKPSTPENSSPEPASKPPDLPRMFGDYELLEEIARGGMGIVYRARQVSLNRIVALKMIRADRVESPADLLRFQFEARAAAGLEHPHIVPLYEVREREGHHFFTMKFIEGDHLAGYLPHLTADFRAAARLIQTVALAVHYAHTRGVLHRDLKPGNILIARDGTPYVSDFGLAKNIEQDSSLTQSGAILGTPRYMAPEQASGKRSSVTVASDIYSLGAILYELLAGRPPFQGDSSFEILQQVIHEEPPRLSQVQSKVPQDLETICLKCLEKEPGRRYTTAEDLAGDLRRFLDGEPIAARPASSWERGVKWCRRRPAPAALIGVICLAVFSLLGVSIWYTAILKSQAEEARAQELLTRRLLYSTRMKLAYRIWDENNCRRLLMLLGSVMPRPGEEDLRSFEWYHLWRLCHRERFILQGHMGPVQQVMFSPDSRRLITLSRGDKVYLWDVVTGEKIHAIEDSSSVLSMDISPDGKTLALARRDGKLIFWDVTSREERLSFDGHKGAINCMAYSQDGKYLATAGSDATVKLWNPASGIELGSLKDSCNSIEMIALSPDGRLLATGSQDPTATIWDLPAGEEKFSLKASFGPVFSLAFLKDSRTLITGCSSGIRFWDLATRKGSAPLRIHKGPVFQISVGPETIATASSDETVVLIDAQSRNILQTLKGHKRGVKSVVVSPDGKWIATGSEDTTARIWMSNLDDEPESHLQDGPVEMAAISRDGRMLTTISQNSTVTVWDLTGENLQGRVEELTRFQFKTEPQASWALSPDSRNIASAENGEIRIWSLNLDGEEVSLQEEARLKGHEAPICALEFSPASRTLISVCKNNVLIIWDFYSSQKGSSWRGRDRFTLPGDEISHLALAPNGTTLAFTRGEDRAVYLWDLPIRKQISKLWKHWKPVVALAFSSDSNLLVSGSEDSTAMLWNVGRRLNEVETRIEAIFLGHTGSITSVAFSPDGKILATGGDDHLVMFWDRLTGEERGSAKVHQGMVQDVVFSRDGKTLVTVGGGRSQFGEVKIWHAGTDEEVERKKVVIPIRIAAR